jgi:hypothetical protein
MMPAGSLYATLTKEYLAFARLALTQRRLAGVARQRMAECEVRGDIPGYRHFRSEARRLVREARYHLWCAQERKARRDA